MPPVKKEESLGTQLQLEQNLDNLELAPTEKELAKEAKLQEKEQQKLEKQKEKEEQKLAKQLEKEEKQKSKALEKELEKIKKQLKKQEEKEAKQAEKQEEKEAKQGAKQLKKYKVTVIETQRWEYEVEAVDSDDAVERYDEAMDGMFEGEMMSVHKEALSAELVE